MAMHQYARLWLLAALAIATNLAGCSLFFDTGPYIGTSTDAGTDASLVDAPPSDSDVDANDPNAPSQPEVTLSPMPARTADDLVAMITTPSIDPMGMTVTYEYRWLRDSAAVTMETAATLPNALTARGELWTVEVTPVAGARRGTPGTASAMIENTAPVLVTVGLDQYHPVVGERVRAVPGSVQDADGDVGALHYEWFRNDVPVPGATGSQLDLSTYVAGDDLRLESWAADADEGPHVSVGSVRVLADVPRWRPITAPALGMQDVGTTNFANDVGRERFIELLSGEAWEFTVSGAEIRGARLAPRGSPPVVDDYQIVLHDELNGRLLVVDTVDPMLLHALDLTHRGGEVWSTIVASGDRPPVDGSPSFTVWRDGNRLWLYGGDIFGSPYVSHLTNLDVTLGAERWTNVPLGGDDPEVLVGTVARHPTLPGHALLVGGVLADTRTANLEIYDIALMTGAVTFEDVGDLPGLRTAAASVAHGDRLLIASGCTSPICDIPLTPLLDFDPASGELSTLAIDRPAIGATRLFVNADGTVDHLVFRGLPGREMELTSLDLVGVEATVIAAEAASPVADGVYAFGEDVRAIERPTTAGSAWTTDTFRSSTRTWLRAATLPDAVLGAQPTPRAGFRAQSNTLSFFTSGLILFGGIDPTTGGLAPADLWELGSDQRWTLHVASGPTPAQRVGAANAAVRCGGSTAYVIAGGRADGGGELDDTWILRCATARDCAWEQLAVTGLRPPTHADSSLVATSAGAVFLARVGTPDLFRLTPCAPGPWTSYPNAGAPPSVISRNTMTYTGPAGMNDTFLVVGTSGAGGADLVFRVTWTGEMSWESVPLDFSDSPGPALEAAPVIVWSPADDRAILLGTETWELLFR
jgi:hypothetical protein